MGFQSPAQDYIQRRLTVNDRVVHNPLALLKINANQS